MTVLDNFKKKDIDELVEWLDEYCVFDTAPWIKWWDKKYCDNCESITKYVPEFFREMEYAWCELNNDKCKFFQDMSEIPDNKQIIKMWLMSEVEQE